MTLTTSQRSRKSKRSKPNPERLPEKEHSPKTLRINKLLSERGLGSRRNVEEAIKAGAVSVNGKVVRDLSSKFPDDVTIHVKGRELKRKEKVLYLFHKPRSVVTTLSDPHSRKCVGDFVKNLDFRVFPVGRLDYDVSGLLLLTNDGDFADSLLHPKYEVEREYLARVQGDVASDKLKLIVKGVEDGNKSYKAKRASYASENSLSDLLLGKIKEGESLLSIVVTEGSYHFVKELLRLVGHPVLKLSRVRFDRFLLGKLRPGEMKQVSYKTRE